MSVEIVFNPIVLTAKQYEDCLRALPNPAAVLHQRQMYPGKRYRVAVFAGDNHLSALDLNRNPPVLSEVIHVDFDLSIDHAIPQWKPSQTIIIKSE